MKILKAHNASVFHEMLTPLQIIIDLSQRLLKVITEKDLVEMI